MVDLKGRANKIWYNGKKLDYEPSLKIKNHSPTGFSWGYLGSGPAQLALAILLKYGEEAGYIKFVDLALANYQDFKQNFIGDLPDIKFHVRVDLKKYFKKGDIKWENI